MTNAPTEPGGFEGDIYYGDPIKTTMGTHRWQGGEWYELPSETEAVLGLLAKARTDLDAALVREHELREALKAEHAYWDAKAAADLRLQDAGEIAMDYPMPRRMTEAMRKADALAAALGDRA